MTDAAAAQAIAPEEPRFAALRKLFSPERPATIAAALVVLGFIVVALLAPVIAPHDPLAQSYLRINAYPSADYWLGTDQFGRDVLSRLLYGARNSLLFGLISPAIAATVGTALGVSAGYFGGAVDRVVSRLIDTLLAFPELLLAIMVAAVLGGGFWNVVMVIAIAFVPGFARVARAATLSVMQEPYIEATVAVGLGTPKTIWRHVLPNISAPIVVLATLWVASAIRLEASLSFLGIGTRPPAPSWGNIIRDGLGNIFGSPWPIVGAGAAITIVVLAFNLVGDALRDLLDPDTH
jgi:peptide/nickel transport system permease protein